MPSLDAPLHAPVPTSPPYHAIRNSTRNRSPFGALLTVAGLAAGLFVAQAATAMLDETARHTESVRPTAPDPVLAPSHMTDYHVVEKSRGGRIDVPLHVNLASLPNVPDVSSSDVALVTHTTAGNLPLRSMSYDEFATNPSQILDLLPTLDALQVHMPTGAFLEDVDRQKEHIRQLDQEAQITLEGFESFAPDRQYRAFEPSDQALERIEPRMFIVHWTGGGYDDVDHFLRVMGRLRVQFFIDRNARVYDLFSSDDERPSHALGANDFSQGVEIETGHFDDVNSPVFGYTAEQITQTVYLAVDFLRRNGLPVDRTTIVGHYAADLIFSNPYYNPSTGIFSQGRIRKFDPPEELMHVIINKAQALDRALDNTLTEVSNHQQAAGPGSQRSPRARAGLDSADVRRRLNADAPVNLQRADQRQPNHANSDQAPNRRR